MTVNKRNFRAYRTHAVRAGLFLKVLYLLSSVTLSTPHIRALNSASAITNCKDTKKMSEIQIKTQKNDIVFHQTPFRINGYGLEHADVLGSAAWLRP